MSNRAKIFSVIGLVFLATAVLTYFATTVLVQSNFSKIEIKDTEKNTARAVDALDNRVDQLQFKVTDWSSWDDTYQFVKDHNAEYIKSNLQSGSLQNLGINFMLFFDTSQRMVHAKSIDLDSGDDIPLPTELVDEFKPGSALLAKAETSVNLGFIRTGTQPIFLVSKPILTSDSTGPVRGTLVFAQYLTPVEITKLANLTHLDLAYYGYGTGGLPADVEAVQAEITSDTARVQVLGPNRIAGYQLVKDLHGRPLLVARVELPRDLYTEAGHALMLYLVIIGLVTLSSIVISIYTTNQIVNRDRTIRLKDEFFSIASHEIRTPLAAIRGNSQLIKTEYGPKNDTALTDMANDIYASSVRLIKIVTNFLDAARLERGQLPLTLQAVQLHGPIASVVSELEAVCREKSLTLKADIPAGLPAVIADPERVQQVVYNLVGNAMKFTDTGGITITAQDAGNMVKIMVADTGRGISREGQKKLFKRFQQTRRDDAAVGSGLGLYISKLMVEKMGGRITLESSAEGQGTTISFSLPKASATH